MQVIVAHIQAPLSLSWSLGFRHPPGRYLSHLDSYMVQYRVFLASPMATTISKNTMLQFSRMTCPTWVVFNSHRRSHFCSGTVPSVCWHVAVFSTRYPVVDDFLWIVHPLHTQPPSFCKSLLWLHLLSKGATLSSTGIVDHSPPCSSIHWRHPGKCRLVTLHCTHLGSAAAWGQTTVCASSDGNAQSNGQLLVAANSEM